MEAALSAAGYNTGFAGKLLNSWPVGTNPDHFDRWATSRGGYVGAIFNIDGQVRPVNRYSTDFIGAKSVEFLKDFESEDESPWFMQVNVFAPHAPYTPAPRDEDAIVPRWEPNPAVLESDRRDKPDAVRKTSYGKENGESVRKEQLRSLMAVDDLVGRLHEELDELDETRDTLVIYLSDHGYLWGEHGRLWKRTAYLPSLEIPLIMKWPGHVPANATSDELVANIDLAPTILDLANVGSPSGWTFDGKSLVDGRGHRFLGAEYWEEPGHGFPTWRAIRAKKWTYVSYPGSEREFYDLERDPHQLHNLLGDRTKSNDPDIPKLDRMLDWISDCPNTKPCP